ncbi:MAG: tRNA guanosine(34) transglycosylase Tgt [Bacteroidetes bacterium HGW-Bacteroidetes-17]|jgi:queuine tRNA-ribosyltransferase|nr:MAG: tRNA guanosine(34) transglycosylase Tgt [Bacteroidetes bacterium HGW-Bacteroidetes-17]
MKFSIKSTDKNSNARTGTLATGHGNIETPIFMPVGTVGAVKAVQIPDLLTDTKAQIILGNTYHLYLRPGLNIIEEAGGLHKFNGWDKPILTDSGGYQVYSLANTRKLTEKGVVFRSHIDGSKHEFTPENVMDIQRTIGADIIMAFDECTPYPCEYDYAKNSLKITHQWLDRCIAQFDRTRAKYGYDQMLFPIVQGSVYKDLRVESAEFIASKNAIGNAIGGLSVGEPHEMMYEMTELVCNILPKDKPRYLMGVGTPENILESIALGIDMFDCVMPTRNARHGLIYTSDGIINIKNEKWKNDFGVLDENGQSYVDHQYSKAYVRHLFAANEILGGMITSLHNLAFYLWLVKEARTHIFTGDFTSWKNTMVKKLSARI